MIIDVNDLLGFTKVGHVTRIGGATTLEARAHAFAAETGEDAASRLRRPRVNSPDLETATGNANQPARNIDVKVTVKIMNVTLLIGRKSTWSLLE